MLVTIELPRPLWNLADGRQTMQYEAETVGTALRQLTEQYPALRPHLEDEGGYLRETVEVTLDGADIEARLDLLTPLQDGAVIAIVPVIRGGKGRR